MIRDSKGRFAVRAGFCWLAKGIFLFVVIVTSAIAADRLNNFLIEWQRPPARISPRTPDESFVNRIFQRSQ